MYKSSAVLFLPWDSSPTCPFILEMFYSNLFLLRGGEKSLDSCEDGIIFL